MKKNGRQIRDVVLNRVKLKVNFTLGQATKALGGSRVIPLLFP